MKKVLAISVFLFASVLAFATASSPVTVSSINCSAGTCTVTTSTAHNIPTSGAEFGFCLQGGPTGDVLCGAAATVPSTTTFTVSNTINTSMATCSSSCGTAQPAKSFLILGNPFNGQLGLQSVFVCIWVYVQNPLPSPNKTSACSAAESNATLLSAENGALASGNWAEFPVTLSLAAGDTRAEIEQECQRIQLSAQNQIVAGIQFGRDLGTFCDVIGCNQ